MFASSKNAESLSAAVEIPYAGHVPLPPNVRPVIILSGSDYEMGYQFYQQLIEIFGPWILEKVAGDRFTENELKSKDVYEAYIKEYAPEFIEMFEGMAQGAADAGVSLSYDEVLSHFVKKKFLRWRPPTDCSGFAAWGTATKNGRLICAGSTDHEVTFEITLMGFPETGNNFILSPFRPTEFGWLGGHPGMNNKGLAYVHHGATHWIRSKPEEKWTEGITEGIANLHTLRFASNAAEAKDMQLAYPSGDGFAGGFWVDVQGHSYVIESRENPRAIRKPGDYDERDFLYSTNNALCKELAHCQNPPPKGNVYIPHGGWLGTGATISSVPRNVGLWDMLHHYHSLVDLAFVEMVTRFPGTPPRYPTLEEADAAYYKKQGEGWDPKMCNLENALVGIMIPDNGNEGLYWVSHGCPARIAYPLLPYGHYYRIAPTYSYYQLKLAANPQEVSKAAKDRAQYELYYANQELRKLTYSDHAYAPLDRVFNEAAIEWHKGLYYEDRIQWGLVKQNREVYMWSKTLRAYTRCQALAKQVYNSLVPPAEKPEDLGLKPWGFWNKEKK
jgi:hypothetical protein